MNQPAKNELLELLKKARAGKATGEDYSRMAVIINADQSGELVNLVNAFLEQEPPVASKHTEPYDNDYWQQVFLEIKASWQQKKSPQAPVRPLWRRWWLAASIVMLLSAVAWLLTKKDAAPTITNSTEILPGKDGAILSLANGSQVLLDTIQNGVVATQGGATARIENGVLIYGGRAHEPVMHTMSTPKARKFHLVLPDGTHAWLNSASSIRYPTSFTGSERKVNITGEVYFEVARNEKMPFRLNVNNRAEIEVLGTHFNVKAYENESVINTTLLEGSIAISLSGELNKAAKKRGKFILKPGQQAQILVGQNKLLVDGRLPKEEATLKLASSDVKVVDDTDIDKVMAWKNGVFDFNDIAFEDAMYQLERWYDIQVVYENGIPADVELNGKITKDNKLKDVVAILEKIGVNCRLEGRRLFILP
jgi:Fe2+-dicitrate sensor, membrane component